MAEKLTPKQYFEEVLAKRIEGNPDRAKSIGGVYEFVIEGEDGGTWHLDLSVPKVSEGAAEKMDCRIRMKSDDFVALASGELNEMVAFTQGKLKVEGNIAKALKLRQLLSPQGW